MNAVEIEAAVSDLAVLPFAAAEFAYEHNWSRNILVMQIETRLHERSGTATSNFAHTLPKPESDLCRAASAAGCGR